MPFMKHFLKRTLTMTLLFFVLIVALELLYRLLKVPKIAHHDIYAKAQNLVPKINNSTILVIGDSRPEWGIKPLTIAEKIKEAGIEGNVVNMATPGKNGLDVLRFLVKNDIHPRIIIHGYAPNYGTHKNHGTDTIEYSLYNRKYEAFNHWLDKNCYFRDQSVWYWIKRTPLYFKSHVYDSLGGVTVTENGAYTARAVEQQKMFSGFTKNFKQAELNKYEAEANELIKKLQSKGSVVYGVYMPVAKKIYELLDVTENNIPNIPAYNRFYEWSSFTYKNEAPAHDSTFYYDDCHLNPVYAIIFTKKLVDSILTDYSVKYKH